MMLFRSLTVGLLGACLVLILLRPDAVPRVEHERELVATKADLPTIIDVAPGISTSQIAQLVRLAPNERVTAVDDQPVTGNLDAGAVIAPPTGRTFIDLTIGLTIGRLTIGRTDSGTQRRVLVLVH